MALALALPSPGARRRALTTSSDAILSVSAPPTNRPTNQQYRARFIIITLTLTITHRFNINNGFFVADHSVEECQQMHDFFYREFNARIDAQLLDFDPYAEEAKPKGKKSRASKKKAKASR